MTKQNFMPKGLYRIGNLSETNGCLVIVTKKYAFIFKHGFSKKEKHYAEGMRNIRNAAAFIHDKYSNIEKVDNLIKGNRCYKYDKNNEEYKLFVKPWYSTWWEFLKRVKTKKEALNFLDKGI